MREIQSVAVFTVVAMVTRAISKSQEDSVLRTVQGSKSQIFIFFLSVPVTTAGG